MREVRDLFQKAFGAPPAVVVEAPGRLELLGNHTDYNRGLVMALAVDKYIYVAATPRKDAIVELVSSSFPGSREKFYLDKIMKKKAASTGTSGFGELKYFTYPEYSMNGQLAALDDIEQQIAQSAMQFQGQMTSEDDLVGTDYQLEVGDLEDRLY